MEGPTLYIEKLRLYNDEIDINIKELIYLTTLEQQYEVLFAGRQLSIVYRQLVAADTQPLLHNQLRREHIQILDNNLWFVNIGGKPLQEGGYLLQVGGKLSQMEGKLL